MAARLIPFEYFLLQRVAAEQLRAAQRMRLHAEAVRLAAERSLTACETALARCDESYRRTNDRLEDMRLQSSACQTALDGGDIDAMIALRDALLRRPRP